MNAAARGYESPWRRAQNSVGWFGESPRDVAWSGGSTTVSSLPGKTSSGLSRVARTHLASLCTGMSTSGIVDVATTVPFGPLRRSSTLSGSAQSSAARMKMSTATIVDAFDGTNDWARPTPANDSSGQYPCGL